MIRNVMAEAISKGTEKRRKVDYVGRMDGVKPTDEKSVLGRNAAYKTNVIDEVIGDTTGANAPIDNEETKKKKKIVENSAMPMGDVETTGKDDSGKGTDEKKNKKKAGAESEHDDPKMIKGGKTEVILKPHTDDSSRDESQEKMDSDKARRKANKEIGQKGAPVKEETIFESTSDAHSHMKKAMKCYEAGDIGGHHAHMANYHHIMSGHHARAGRHHVADAHVKRAEYHMDEAAKFGPLDTAGPDAKPCLLYTSDAADE